MNKEKINAGIDRMAEEAKETMNLLSDKIDRATRCGNEKAARIKRSAKATDAVQETVDRTAERIRDKLSE
jgi:methyl-accepting chemotaxis protein